MSQNTTGLPPCSSSFSSSSAWESGHGGHVARQMVVPEEEGRDLVVWGSAVARRPRWGCLGGERRPRWCDWRAVSVLHNFRRTDDTLFSVDVSMRCRGSPSGLINAMRTLNRIPIHDHTTDTFNHLYQPRLIYLYDSAHLTLESIPVRHPRSVKRQQAQPLPRNDACRPFGREFAGHRLRGGW
jgi:hypothetical protein